MRLLVVSQYFWPENFRINDLVAELVRRGHQVTVLTGEPNYPDGAVFQEYRDDPQSFLRYEGANVVRVPMTPRGVGRLRLALNYVTFAASASVFGLLRLGREKFDAIFVFEPSPITVGLPALAMKWRTGAPIAFWVLDLWPQSVTAVSAVRSRLVLGLLKALVGVIYRGCDLILAQSRSFMADIAGYLPDAARVRYFPSWSDETPERVEPDISIPDNDGTFSIMFAGNIGAAQDFPAIIEAADALRDEPVRWLILGDGRQADWVRGEIARRDLVGQVILLGRHPLSHMPAFFKHADALLVSLRSDPIFALTIPGKLQTYLASGVAVLAMLDGEGADVVREAGAGFTARAGDAAGLAAAIRAMAALPKSERVAMGARGRAFSEAHFNRRALIEQLEQWLLDLAASRGKKK
jgi:glycosyltransferase involved in cell wall biosynthesis